MVPKVVDLGVIEKRIPEKVHETVVMRIHGKIFIFDKESLKIYNEEFVDDYHDIIVEEGYLCRNPKWNRKEMDIKHFQFFHRYIMDKEVGEFEEENGEKGFVHHLTMCKRVNIKRYLKVVTKEQHDRLHSGYYASYWIYPNDI